MKNVRRYFEGGYYFFTITSYRRRPFFQGNAYICALRNSIRETMKTHPFEIEAWVILPDHMHCVWSVNDEHVALGWRKIKALTTKGLNEFSNKSSDHRIRNEQQHELYVLYCCYNPVKHGYVENALEWPHSTLKRYPRNGKIPTRMGRNKYHVARRCVW